MSAPTEVKKLSLILDDYANFKVWESQQSWKDDYDRDGNIANSRNRALAQIAAAIEAEIIGKNEPRPPEESRNRKNPWVIMFMRWQTYFGLALTLLGLYLTLWLVLPNIGNILWYLTTPLVHLMGGQ